MNKSRIFVIIAALALIMLSLCACGNTEPPIKETQTNIPQSAVATNAVDSTLKVETTEGIESSDVLPEASQGENDLAIITAPQEDEKTSDNTVATNAVTETVSKTEEATEPSTTEVKRIELPFVPAN